MLKSKRRYSSSVFASVLFSFQRATAARYLASPSLLDADQRLSSVSAADRALWMRGSGPSSARSVIKDSVHTAPHTDYQTTGPRARSRMIYFRIITGVSLVSSGRCIRKGINLCRPG